MLIAAGPGIANLQDFTEVIDFPTLSVRAQQSNAFDEFDGTLHDPLNLNPIRDEDELVVLEENDPNGFPAINLCANVDIYGTGFTNWLHSTVTGVTYAQDTVVSGIVPTYPGKLVWANATNSASYSVYQILTLPVDHTGACLAVFPYYFSLYIAGITAAVAATGVLAIDWLASDQTTVLGTVSTSLSAALALSDSRFLRYAVSGTPPAGAVYAKVRITLTFTSGTNSGQIDVQAPQFEYALFAGAKSSQFPPQQLNPVMEIIGFDNGSHNYYPFAWIPFNRDAGTTFKSHQQGGGAGQQALYSYAADFLYAAAGSGSTRGLEQRGCTVNPNNAYSCTAAYYYVSNFGSGTLARLHLQPYDASGNTLGSLITVTAAINSGAGAWQSLTLDVGYGTANPLPVGTATLAVQFGAFNASSTITGTLICNGAALELLDLDLQSGTALSAAQANMYPTLWTYEIVAFITPEFYRRTPTTYADTDAPSPTTSSINYRMLRIFGGFVRQKRRDYTHTPEGNIEIHAVDFGSVTVEAQLNIVLGPELDIQQIDDALTYASNLGYITHLNGETYDIYPFLGQTSAGTAGLSGYSGATLRDFLNQLADAFNAYWYVDPYKRLRYGPILDREPAFALSDTPDDGADPPTYPYANFVVLEDSTQSVTRAAVRGQDLMDEPATDVQVYAQFNSPQLQTAITGGGTLTSISITTLPGGAVTWLAGDSIGLYDLGTNLFESVMLSADVSIPGSTTASVPIAAHTFAHSYTTGGPTVLAPTSFDLVRITGVPTLAQILDTLLNVKISGTLQTLYITTSAQPTPAGYAATFYTDTGVLLLAQQLQDFQVITMSYTFTAPLLVAAISEAAEAQSGAIRRPIYWFQQEAQVVVLLDGVLASAAQLNQFDAPNAILTLTLWTPSMPLEDLLTLRPGMAVRVTHAGVGYDDDLFQITDISTLAFGNGVYSRQLGLGLFDPRLNDLIALERRQTALAALSQGFDPTATLADVVPLLDGYQIIDSLAAPTIVTVAVWGDGTHVTTGQWNGTNLWA